MIVTAWNWYLQKNQQLFRWLVEVLTTTKAERTAYRIKQLEQDLGITEGNK